MSLNITDNTISNKKMQYKANLLAKLSLLENENKTIDKQKADKEAEMKRLRDIQLAAERETIELTNKLNQIVQENNKQATQQQNKLIKINDLLDWINEHKT